MIIAKKKTKESRLARVERRIWGGQRLMMIVKNKRKLTDEP